MCRRIDRAREKEREDRNGKGRGSSAIERERAKRERRKGEGGQKGEKPRENYWPDEVLTSGNAIDKGSVRTSRKRETKNCRRRNRSSEASKKRGHEYG